MTDPDRDLVVRAPGSTSSPSRARPATRRSRRPRSEFTVDQARPATGAWSSPCPTRTRAGRAPWPRSRACCWSWPGVAFLVAVLVAAFLARRFTTPLTRLTEASRRLAEGDLSSRVTTDEVSSSTTELRALSQQFNTMADRLEQSVAIIRRDRDYSRDFLADVSHELRTPIAAMRTFIELLQGPAGRDPAARTEFLDSSAVQLDRLDWLAQNLLELSKLDSGLVLLDLRPDDVRGTIESAVEQQQPAAERKGLALTTVPAVEPAPDPPRPAAARPGRSPTSSATRSSSRSTDGSTSCARQLPDGGAQIEVVRHGRRHPGGRAAADLRPLLPRLRGQRGPRHGLRPRAGDREVDRRHAPRDDRGREPGRGRVAVRGAAAARPARRAAIPRRRGSRPAKVDESSPSEGPAMNPVPAP